jgi:hypothetical protein
MRDEKGIFEILSTSDPSLNGKGVIKLKQLLQFMGYSMKERTPI